MKKVIYMFLFIFIMVGCSGSPKSKGVGSFLKDYDVVEAESFQYLIATSQFNDIVLLIYNKTRTFADDVTSRDFANTIINNNFLSNHGLSNVKVIDHKFYDSIGSEIIIERTPRNIIIVKRLSGKKTKILDHMIVEARLDGASGAILSFIMKDNNSVENTKGSPVSQPVSIGRVYSDLFFGLSNI